MLLLVVFLVRRLTNSLFGILLRGIKENETRVKFLGYDTFAIKMAAFILSTTLSAFAGALFIINYSYVTTSFIDPLRSVEVIFACLIGGAGSVYGALAGGVGYKLISNYLPNYIQRWEMFLGVVLSFWCSSLEAGCGVMWRPLSSATTGRPKSRNLTRR